MKLLPRIKNRLRRIVGKDEIYVDENKFVIDRFLPVGALIVEAGACDGRDSRQMAFFWPSAHIYAFEPVPVLFEGVKSACQQFGNITVIPAGLAPVTGEIELFLSSGMSSGSSSILKPKEHLQFHPEVQFEESIKIKAYNLDEWMAEFKIKKIDLLWLDIQGAEYSILKASPKALKSVKLIFSEVSLVETYQGVLLYDDYRKWLSEQGFAVEWEDIRHNDMGNVLFRRVK